MDPELPLYVVHAVPWYLVVQDDPVVQAVLEVQEDPELPVVHAVPWYLVAQEDPVVQAVLEV